MTLRLCLLLLALHHALPGAEVQHHGLLFEHWLCDTFFHGYRPENYTQKWDIPAAQNTTHGNLPVNPKAIKYKTPIGLGDAIRQFEITRQPSPFILVVAFWDQSSPTRKEWVNAQTVTITPETWAALWHPITLSHLQQLDSIVKDKTLSLEQARAQAQAFKSVPPFTEAIIQVNPKIDKSQRRLQCSLSFQRFFTHLAPDQDPSPQKSPSIWGHPIPPIPNSPPRKFPKPNQP